MLQTVRMNYVPDETVLQPATPDSSLGNRALRAYMAEIVGRYHGRAVTETDIDQAMRDNPSGDLRPPGGLLVVAHQRDTPVGCGGLRWLDDHVAEVTRVYVAEPARGYGLGTRLMAELERLARGHGRTTLRLDTRSDLTEARRLYADLGYREIAPYNTSSYAEHWFEKNLT